MKWIEAQRKFYNKEIKKCYESIAYWTDQILEAENQDNCNHKWESIQKRKADGFCFDPGEEKHIHCLECDLKIHSDTKYEDHKKLFIENYK